MTIAERDAMLSFLLGQFQMHSPTMNGQHSWRFRNGGWPMTHARGPTIEDAIESAMAENERGKSEMREYTERTK